jgi:hypothetical protein
MHAAFARNALGTGGTFMKPSFTIALCATGLCAFTIAVAQSLPSPPPSRGELLYANHCIACHTAQIHWRDKRQVTDWASLKAQVQRWQHLARLGWTETDIVDVARHLNATVYHFAPVGDRLGNALRCTPIARHGQAGSPG